MRIIGVDASTKRVGIFIGDHRDGVLFHVHHCGLSPERPGLQEAELRLYLADGVAAICAKYKPDIVGIEYTFHGPNASTVQTLTKLVASIENTLWLQGRSTITIAPATGAKCLGVSGRKFKGEMKKRAAVDAVNAMWGIELEYEDHDIADAAGIALAVAERAKEAGGAS